MMIQGIGGELQISKQSTCNSSDAKFYQSVVLDKIFIQFCDISVNPFFLE